jgi:CRP-like cAMP-binding protein
MLGTLDKMRVLKSSPLFSTLTFDDLGELTKIATLRRYGPGVRIISESEIGDAMFIIISGRVKIFRTRGGQEVLGAVLGQFEYFGEMALIDEKPRSASVESIEETVLLCIRKEDFRNLLMMYPEISFEMLRIFSERFRERVRAG